MDWKIASWSDDKKAHDEDLNVICCFVSRAKVWSQRGPQHLNYWALAESGLLNSGSEARATVEALEGEGGGMGHDGTRGRVQASVPSDQAFSSHQQSARTVREPFWFLLETFFRAAGHNKFIILTAPDGGLSVWLGPREQ